MFALSFSTRRHTAALANRRILQIKKQNWTDFVNGEYRHARRREDVHSALSSTQFSFRPKGKRGCIYENKKIAKNERRVWNGATFLRRFVCLLAHPARVPPASFPDSVEDGRGASRASGSGQLRLGASHHVGARHGGRPQRESRGRG